MLQKQKEQNQVAILKNIYPKYFFSAVEEEWKKNKGTFTVKGTSFLSKTS